MYVRRGEYKGTTGFVVFIGDHETTKFASPSLWWRLWRVMHFGFDSDVKEIKSDE